MATRRCRNCNTEFSDDEIQCPECGTRYFSRTATGVVIMSILAIILMITMFEPWVWILGAILIPTFLFLVLSYFE